MARPKTTGKKGMIPLSEALPEKGDILHLTDGTKQTVASCDGKYIYTDTAQFRLSHKSIAGFSKGVVPKATATDSAAQEQAE